MTQDELTAFLQLLCGPARADHDEGFYPQIAAKPRVLKVWHTTMRAYPFERACKALTGAYKADPRHEPAVDAVVEAIKSQAPPVLQPPAWYQRLEGPLPGQSLRDVLASARPVHDDLNLAQCYHLLVDKDLVVTGQEADFIAACQRFAQQYPADAAHWQAEIARKQAETDARGPHPPRPTAAGGHVHARRGAAAEKEPPMICRWCREPLETVQVQYEGLTIIQDCIRPACVQARTQELGGRRDARALSRQRQAGRVVACLPGMHEPYGYTPPGQTRQCRHCGAVLPGEDRQDATV